MHAIQAATRNRRRATIDLPWWLNPIWPASIVFGVAVIAAVRGGAAQYDVWNSNKYINQHFIGLMFYGFAAFIAGIMLASTLALSISLRHDDTATRPVIDLDESEHRLFDRFAHAMFLLTILGYVAWVGLSLSRGASITNLLDVIAFKDGAISRLKSVSAPVAGVTTLTQLAPLAVTIRLLLRRLGSDRRRYEITLILILSAARAFLYAERLAIIEIVVPLLIISVVVPAKDGRSLRNRLLPLLFLPALWGVFAVFEYTRSWTYYSRLSDISFVDYITQRLLGYYVTAVNNSAMYHSFTAGVDHDIVYPWPALWNAPVIGSLLGSPQIESLRMGTWWALVLRTYGNPEFNNVGTFLVTDADFGTLGSMVYWFILGAGMGFLYAGVRRGSVPAIIAFSCCWVGLLEIVRIIYWLNGRFSPTAAAIVILIGLAAWRRGHPEATPTPPIADRAIASHGVTRKRRESLGLETPG